MMATNNKTEDNAAESGITRDLLEKALNVSMNRTDIVVKDWTIEMVDSLGSLSTAFACTVISHKDEVDSKHRFFIKTLPANALKRQLVQTMSYIFQKEIEVYSRLLPAYHSLQEDLGVEPIVPSAPSFYYGAVEKDEAFLLMEDMRDKGYRVVDIKDGLDYPHCQLVMKEIAKWHALSYALKANNPEALKDKFPYIFQEAFSKKEMSAISKPFYKAALDLAVEMLSSSTNDESLKMQAKKLQSLDVMKTVMNASKPEEPFSVICHGDLWSNNILFKHNADGYPIAASILDFQLIRYAPPTTDLALFFLTSTTGETRQNHLQDLLKLYHATFIGCLEHVRVDFPEFTQQFLQQKFKEALVLRLVRSCAILSEYLATAVDPLSEDFTNKEDILKQDWPTILSKRAENNSMMTNRLVAALQDTLAAGVL